MTIDLVSVDQAAPEATAEDVPPAEVPPEHIPPQEDAPPVPEVETAPTPARKRGRPPGSKNKAKPPAPAAPPQEEEEEEDEEPPPPPKRKVRVEVPKTATLPEPKMSPHVPIEAILRQRMMDVHARADEERALRQAQYTEMLAQKMGF